MIQYSIKDVKEGMILGKSIFLPNGELLLAAGYEIKQNNIDRLIEMEHQSIYIEERGTEEVIPELIVSEHLVRELEVSLAKSFSGLESLSEFKEISKKEIEKELESNEEKFKDIIITKSVKDSTRSIVDQILENPSVVLNLSSLKTTENYLYQHAINVAIISVCIGKKFGFTRDELEDLAVGALGFDLGMVAVPKEILKKPDKLAVEEFEKIKEHPTYGYLILSKNPAIPPTASAVAFQHHERQDGKGYIRGMTGENKRPYKSLDSAGKIHRFAEIVSVADCYDAMISNRPYRPALSPIKAVEELIREAGHHLNKEIIKEIVFMIPFFPVGAQIEVTDCVNPLLIGARGIVAKENPAKLSKPELLLLSTKKGKKIDPPRPISMEDIPSLKIELII